MTLWPRYNETIVLPLTAKEAVARLKKGVRMDRRNFRFRRAPINAGYFFTGYIGDKEFRIAPSVSSSPGFAPMIAGSIEPTSKGCIVLVRYRLFYGSAMYMAFWIAVCFFMVLLFGLYYMEPLPAIVAGVFGAVNIIIPVRVFRMHLKRSRAALKRLFTENGDAG